MAPYCYRCPLGLTYPGCQVQCARDIEELIQTTTTGKIAGFLAEPILGVGGFITPPPEYFEIAVEIVRDHGGVFICDEVQTGFGRTGRMFGIEHWGVEPEIMTMAKAIASGMPLAVTIATPEIADSFRTLTISTFGGNPMSAAAAHATLDVMEQDDLPANAEAMGQRLFEGLETLKKKYPRMVGDVRGKGLMIGVELVKNEEAGDRTPDPQATNRFLEETKERGLLVGKGGLYGNCLRIAPPLTVGCDEIDHALEICYQSLAAMKDA
jgi:4-aminobutyrate aminotransferase-like enzyme